MTPQDEKYAATVRAMVPIVDPPEIIAARIRLLKTRDYATRGLGNGVAHSPEAMELYRVIVSVATSYAFRLHRLSDMGSAADLCLQLLRLASNVDRLCHGDATR